MLNRTNTRGVIPEWISNHYNNIKIIIQLIYWSLRLSSYITSFKIFLKFPEDVCGSLSKHVEYQKLPIVQLAGSKCVYIKMTRKIYNMTVLDTRVWSMIMVCPHAKFHIPGSSSFFLVKPIKLYLKKFFRKVVQILCCMKYYCSEKQQIFGHPTFSLGLENTAAVKNSTC